MEKNNEDESTQKAKNDLELKIYARNCKKVTEYMQQRHKKQGYDKAPKNPSVTDKSSSMSYSRGDKKRLIDSAFRKLQLNLQNSKSIENEGERQDFIDSSYSNYYSTLDFIKKMKD